MNRQYPKDQKKMDRLEELVDLISDAVPFNIWAECLLRISEYLAAGQDSESALDNTYHDMIDTGDIEGISELSEEEVELIKTHLHYRFAADYNPILFN